MMKKAAALFLAFAMILCAAACTAADPAQSTAAPTQAPGPKINDIALSEYAIVYSEKEPAYNLRAAEYIRDQILEITGVTLEIRTDTDAAVAHEIIVGESTRPLSGTLDADTQGLEFAIIADDTGIAMEGDYFVIAAAAYYFVDTYISGEIFDAVVPKTVDIKTPITETPKNYIMLIGDGMGPYQTKMFEYLETPSYFATEGEDLFFGYMLPYLGESQTKSNNSSVTDSAAGGTALSTGYKTNNGYVGKNKKGEDIQSLTELAISQGMSTAVMTTDVITGATPASFSAHSISRDNTEEIQQSQALLTETVFHAVNEGSGNKQIYRDISDILSQLSSDPDGFFVMYEEAIIDKCGHNNELTEALRMMYRFNRVIGQFMEFAFYHPDTFVLITADHETGDLRPEEDGELVYHSNSHSAVNVPVFAYGAGAEIFDGVTVENVQIPKTIAKMWGVEDFGDTASEYPALELN